MTFVSRNDSPAAAAAEHPLQRLPREDLDLIVELVLRSGSLKDLATAYGVSYPTIRNRLDRVIERLKGLVEGRAPDPMSELLADLVGRGELTPSAARSVRDLSRKLAEGARTDAPSIAKGGPS